MHPPPSTDNQEHPKGSSMNSLLLFVLFVAAYFALQLFILPKLGVPT